MDDLSHIAEPLRRLAVPVADLTPDPRNARRHNERNMAAVEASLRRFGQRVPLVVQRQGMVVRAGNARLEAAKRLGWSHVAAVVVDEDDVQATAYAIADNRTAELAEWDYQELGALLAELGDADIDMPLEDLGWLDYEVDPLVKAEWEPAKPDGDLEDHRNEKTHTIRLSASEGERWGELAGELRKRLDDGDRLTEGQLVLAIAEKLHALDW